MEWIKSVAREIYGLFVDDFSFALAIVAWLAVMVLVPRVARMAALAGPIFFAGLVAILIESVLRFSRRRSK